jgi:hypothetical protein
MRLERAAAAGGPAFASIDQVWRAKGAALAAELEAV